MTKHLSETLGLPLLEDALRERGLHPGEEARPARNAAPPLDAAQKRLVEVGGEDHAESMDALHGEALRHARDLMDLGFNMEHGRARGIFEQAANFYKIGIDAKNSKRDAQLKAMRLVLDQQRVEIERVKAEAAGGAAPGAGGPVIQGTMVTGDRNELLRMLRDKAAASRD